MSGEAGSRLSAAWVGPGALPGPGRAPIFHAVVDGSITACPVGCHGEGELRAAELFYIPEIPHDSWVVGCTPYVSLHFLGADRYAKDADSISMERSR